MIKTNSNEYKIKLRRAKMWKEGQKVRVTREAETREGGWETHWAPGMDRSVDQVMVVHRVHEKGIVRMGFYLGYGDQEDGCVWPFFVLEEVN